MLDEHGELTKLLSIVVKPRGINQLTYEAREKFRNHIKDKYMSEASEPSEVLLWAGRLA